jgi:hypothetical protein
VECDQHIARALELSEQLLALANADRNGCDHDGCQLLDGIVRDSAVKIRQVALRWLHELHTETHSVRGKQ